MLFQLWLMMIIHGLVSMTVIPKEHSFGLKIHRLLVHIPIGLVGLALLEQQPASAVFTKRTRAVITPTMGNGRMLAVIRTYHMHVVWLLLVLLARELVVFVFLPYTMQ